MSSVLQESDVADAGPKFVLVLYDSRRVVSHWTDSLEVGVSFAECGISEAITHKF